MRRLMLAAAVLLTAVPAHADQYTYRCKTKGKRSIVKIDDTRKTLVWQGKTFKLARELTGGECAKFGWRIEGNGGAGDLCTATQGIADFDMSGANMSCEMKS